MTEPTPSSLPHRIEPLATLTPAGSTRAWLSAPHLTIPIVASASSDKSVRIYSLTSFTLLSTISGGHKRSVRACAWKPNTRGESVLATGSFDSSAGIWRRWEVEGQGIKSRAGEDEDEMDFTRQGGEDDDGDDDEWRFSVVLDGHEAEIKSVAWSPGGQFLATCARDKSVWIWEELDDDNFETVAVLQEHDGDVKCVVWHPQEDLLASASYDDTIRLYKEDLDDWTCVAVINGHGSTVWSLAFEPADNAKRLASDNLSEARKQLLEDRDKSGPRLVSSSDDLSIRIWRRRPKEKPELPVGQRLPSILKSNSIEEDWDEDVRLPQIHERAIYSVDWSKNSGLIVSSGSDGKIIVYKERWREPSTDSSNTETQDSEMMDGVATEQEPRASTEWVVVAEIEAAHDVFEINHVCWTRRRDKNRRSDDEEVIISTGDDGEVKVWTLEIA